MSGKRHEAIGSQPNHSYCKRLEELTFPVKVRIDGKVYDKEALQAELETRPELLTQLAKRYFIARKFATEERVLATVFPDVLKLQGKEYTRHTLATALPHDPKLQQMLAVLTHFTPSKWLLEQEMMARGEWEEGDEDVYTRVAATGLMGVSFSGGGIRSATFNLGVIQGLAQLGLLPHVDYLSSVSGGGYIHEFLAAWILRNRQGRDGVIEELVPQAESGCLPRAPEPIKWLKQYASYLTPARGLFSTDTWTMVSIWLRNTILNQIPIVAALGSVFLFVHLLVPEPEGAMAHCGPLPGMWPWVVETLMFGLAAWSLNQLRRNLHRQRAMRREGPAAARHSKIKLLSNREVQRRVILPWLAYAAWTSYWSRMGVAEFPEWAWVGPAAFGLWVVAVAEVVIFSGGTMDSYAVGHPEAGVMKRGASRLGFAVAGLGAAGIACAIGYGLFKGSLPVAEMIKDWLGPLGGAAEAVKQTLNFSVSGAAQNFTANLSGALSSPAAGAVTGKMYVDPWRIEVVMMPGILLSVPYIAIELGLGLLGREYSDIRREWMARLRAWSLLYALVWGGISGIALLGPYLGYYLMHHGATLKYTTLGTFLTAHLTTIFTGWSGKADGKPTDKGIFGFKPVDFAAMLAAPVTMVGLLLGISSAVAWGVDRLYGGAAPLEQVLHISQQWWGQYWVADALCLVVAGMVWAIFGWRVDVNEFSMQLFYRNRLSRCYLAASVPNRQADPFTGFDMRGDLPGMVNPRARTLPPSVCDLLPNKFDHRAKMEGSYDGPFPIFCTTLNLTTGEDLATQERKGASFAFTPLYSGYSVSWTDGHPNKHVSFNGYVPTEEYAYPKGGIHLDTAVAISGAAVSPNMGYNSNPALAFLMTFFNVRLGWWVTNTRRMDWWKASNGRVTPRFALAYLLKELFGLVNDSSPFVNLSDGGHFDNMGLYELVRRRCRFIVVCDAEQDPGMTFSGMGGAIMKCRADFGAEIDLDLRPLRIEEKTGYSQAHCVVGTIKYPPPLEDRDYAGKGEDAATDCPCLKNEGDDPYTGIIVYMKTSLVGDEPPDLLSYQLAHPAFPQDSTANQWFTETQFEAYRRLGHHVTMSTIQPALSPKKTRFESGEKLEDLFNRMYAIWYPRTPEMVQHLADHLKQYEGILSELRGKPELAGLEAKLSDPSPGEGLRVWLKTHQDKGAIGYATQFGVSVLDFMVTVYLNLELAFPDNRVSPHAEWWICLFRRWCRVDLIHKSWAEHAVNYPLEFRLFARRELGLPKVNGVDD